VNDASDAKNAGGPNDRRHDPACRGRRSRGPPAFSWAAATATAALVAFGATACRSSRPPSEPLPPAPAVEVERLNEQSPAAAALARKAEAALASGQLEQAAEIYAQAPQAAPQSGMPHRRHCELLTRLGRREPAWRPAPWRCRGARACPTWRDGWRDHVGAPPAHGRRDRRRAPAGLGRPAPAVSAGRAPADAGRGATSGDNGRLCRHLRPSRSYRLVCESFFATLECELLDRQRFRTHVDARLAMFDFIEGWSNPRRRHSALDYLSPIIFERMHRPGDRPEALGSTIDQGGAISVSPAAVMQ